MSGFIINYVKDIYNYTPGSTFSSVEINITSECFKSETEKKDFYHRLAEIFKTSKFKAENEEFRISINKKLFGNENFNNNINITVDLNGAGELYLYGTYNFFSELRLINFPEEMKRILVNYSNNIKIDLKNNRELRSCMIKESDIEFFNTEKTYFEYFFWQSGTLNNSVKMKGDYIYFAGVMQTRGILDFNKVNSLNFYMCGLDTIRLNDTGFKKFYLVSNNIVNIDLNGQKEIKVTEEFVFDKNNIMFNAIKKVKNSIAMNFKEFTALSIKCSGIPEYDFILERAAMLTPKTFSADFKNIEKLKIKYPALTKNEKLNIYYHFENIKNIEIETFNLKPITFLFKEIDKLTPDTFLLNVNDRKLFVSPCDLTQKKIKKSFNSNFFILNPNIKNFKLKDCVKTFYPEIFNSKKEALMYVFKLLYINGKDLKTLIKEFKKESKNLITEQEFKYIFMDFIEKFDLKINKDVKEKEKEV